MKIKVTMLPEIGPYEFWIQGHAPNAKYCAAMSLLKEELETCLKYYKNGFNVDCWNTTEPLYTIRVQGFTFECLKAWGMLHKQLKDLIASMNEEYPGSCDYTEEFYKDEEEEYEEEKSE